MTSEPKCFVLGFMTINDGLDSIQILFPLPEGSPFNWQAPVINKAAFDAFRARADLRQSFERGFWRIMAFYGFEQEGTGIDLKRSSDHKHQFRNWVVRMDHNHLRITRVIRALRILGLEKHADAYYEAIQKVNVDFPNRIGERSLMYWKRAAKRPLYLAPDVEDDEATTGQKFLRDYEEAKKDATKSEPVALDSAAVEGAGASTEQDEKEVEMGSDHQNHANMKKKTVVSAKTADVSEAKEANEG